MNRPGIPMSYPVLRELGPLLISRSAVLGHLANWAVRQSPYIVPDKLAEALAGFYAQWPRDEYAQFDTIRELDRTVRGIMVLVPEITEWNQRKNGRDGPGFVTRYSEPSPDDDFIDLDALARNISMSVWHESADDKAFNDDFDARALAAAPSTPESAEKDDASGGKGMFCDKADLHHQTRCDKQCDGCADSQGTPGVPVSRSEPTPPRGND